MFRRYNDVSFLLSTMELSDLYDFIITMYDEISEDRLWYVWNHLPFRETGYQEFKDSLGSSSPKMDESKNREINDEKHGIEVANLILGWEGDGCGTV